MSWEPLPCLFTNSPVTKYVIEYGKHGVNGSVLRTTTRRSFIKSSASSIPSGLGFLVQGAIYFFRVAAENENGLGPFSGNFLGRTGVIPVCKYVANHSKAVSYTFLLV